MIMDETSPETDVTIADGLSGTGTRKTAINKRATHAVAVAETSAFFEINDEAKEYLLHAQNAILSTLL